jgi:electron transfer flavoprotein alpha/beta subunit
MTPIGKAPSARFEISIDGVPRSQRDQRDMAIEAAAQLMLKYPNSVVAVKDLGAARSAAASR